MKKTMIALLALLLTLPSFSNTSMLDDNMSEILAPILSNYTGDHQIRIQARFEASVTPETSTSVPILLSSPVDLKPSSLQDCDENCSSLVCMLSKQIVQWIETNKPSKGAVKLDLTLFQNQQVKKEIKNVEVFRLQN